MKKILFIILLAAATAFGQNLIFTTSTCVSQDSITIDLDYDKLIVQSKYGFTEEEARAIAFVMHGTWTNDSLQVYAAMHPDSTYYPVYYNGEVVTEIATTGSSYICFNPQKYAGIRYLMFIMPANEAATRMYTIVRRRY